MITSKLTKTNVVVDWTMFSIRSNVAASLLNGPLTFDSLKWTITSDLWSWLLSEMAPSVKRVFWSLTQPKNFRTNTSPLCELLSFVKIEINCHAYSWSRSFWIFRFDNYNTNITIDQFTYNVTLWDTAGQEEYSRLRAISYPNVIKLK